MTRSKRRKTKRTYKPEFKAAVVRRVLKGRAAGTETQRSIADELGITETRLSEWVRQAKLRTPSRLPPPRLPPPDRGDAPLSAGLKARLVQRQSPDAEPDPPGPSIELKGLRAWVNHAVRIEVDRILALKGIK